MTWCFWVLKGWIDSVRNGGTYRTCVVWSKWHMPTFELVPWHLPAWLIHHFQALCQHHTLHFYSIARKSPTHCNPGGPCSKTASGWTAFSNRLAWQNVHLCLSGLWWWWDSTQLKHGGCAMRSRECTGLRQSSLAVLGFFLFFTLTDHFKDSIEAKPFCVFCVCLFVFVTVTKYWSEAVCGRKGLFCLMVFHVWVHHVWRGRRLKQSSSPISSRNQKKENVCVNLRDDEPQFFGDLSPFL